MSSVSIDYRSCCVFNHSRIYGSVHPYVFLLTQLVCTYDQHVQYLRSILLAFTSIMTAQLQHTIHYVWYVQSLKLAKSVRAPVQGVDDLCMISSTTAVSP
jgi:hypothetical protein